MCLERAVTNPGQQRDQPSREVPGTQEMEAPTEPMWPQLPLGTWSSTC